MSTCLPASPPPSVGQARVSRIFRRLFRVYAHIYYAHFEYIVSQKAETHMNSCFKHFVLFSREFGLVDQKEMHPLKCVGGGRVDGWMDRRLCVEAV
jgi:MOB kinase activator 1